MLCKKRHRIIWSNIVLCHHWDTNILFWIPTTTPSGMLGTQARKKKKMNEISAHADGGPRWVCAHLTLRSAPHQHKLKFFNPNISC